MLIVWVFVYKKLAQFAVRGALPPRRSESPGCAADNKPSCALHLLGSFIGSRGFSSLEQRPEFWVLHYHLIRASLVAPTVKRLPAMRETRVWFLGREDPLEKETATHSSTLAWKMPWTEEPGRLQSMGSQRVGHDWATSLTHSLQLGS